MTSASPPALPPPAAPPKRDPLITLKRLIIGVAAGLIGLIVLLFVAAVIIALTSDLDASGDFIRMIRDLVIIFLALEGILIVMALAILIFQVAKLINLLQTEVKPILENTQETVKTAQGTVQFVSENALRPIVRASGMVTGIAVVTSQLFGLRRAIKRTQEPVKPEADDGSAA